MVSLFVVGQDLLGSCHLVGDDTLRLLVNQGRCVFRIRLGEAVVVATSGVIETDVLQFIAHSVVSHHGVRLFGSTLKVVEGTGGGLIQEQLLGSTSAQERTELVENMILVGQLPLFRQIPRSTQSHSTRHDCHFDQGVCPTEHPADGCVSGFVVSDRPFLIVGHDLVLTFQTADDTIHSVHEILLAYFLTFPACRYQRCLVAHVCDVGTRETRGLLAQEIDIHGIIEFERTEVYLEDLLTFLQVGQFHMDLTVKTSGTQQGCIEHIGTVRSR